MQQQARAFGFFQGGAKGGNQLMRQVTDEAHGVGQHGILARGQRQLPQCGVQGGEQLVGCVHLAGGQGIEQRGLAGIGIAHQRHGGGVCPLPRLAAQLAPGAHGVQPPLQCLDAHGQQAPVGFQLGFTRPAQANAALLALQMAPAADQARGQMLQLRQLHLQLPLVRAGALGKDVEDQAGAVQHAGLQQALQVALLAGRQVVVDDHHLGTVLDDQLAHRFGLAAAQEVAGVGGVALAIDHAQHIGARRAGQLDELLMGLWVVPAVEIQVDQNGPLPGLRALKHGG